MGLFGRKRKPKPAQPVARRPPTPEELSSVLQNGLRGVQEAAGRCSRTQGDELVAAWRQLRTVLRDSVAAMAALVSADPQNPRLRRMTRLTTDELWEIAEPWVNVKFVIAHRIPMTTEEMANLQRDLWGRAEAVIAAYAENPGEEARARLQRMVDEVRTDADALVAARGEPIMTERQALMWQLAAEEIAQFAADAFARQPNR